MELKIREKELCLGKKEAEVLCKNHLRDVALKAGERQGNDWVSTTRTWEQRGGEEDACLFLI